MNEYDSEKMLAGLGSEYTRIEEPGSADLILINTCSVREKAEHKLYGLLGRMAQLKEKRPEVIVGVGGCVAQQEGRNILSRSKAVNFVVGTHNISLVPSLVSQAQSGGERAVAIDYREDWEDLPLDFDSAPLAQNQEIAFGSAYNKSVRALVAIQRGCSKHCSFCVVPTTRGEEVSRNPQEIIREITLKVRLGAKEVMLLGQTVNSYGKDLSPRLRFHELVRQIAEIPGLERIRFTSPHPAEVKPEFIELFGEVPCLCPHIHMPLQSGSDRILKAMNRNYRVARYLSIIDELKTRVPDISITTDIIVGFPTETDEDFEQTLNVMKTVGYSLSYSFKYSERPNTTAATKYDKSEHVSAAVQKERLTRLQALQDGLSLQDNQRWLEKPTKVLIESQGDNANQFFGRIPQNTRVELHSPDLKVGQLVDAKIVNATAYGLFAKKIENTDG
jgi:tRNA-2-methylthio-N6-dimethylallyladenosine synthase